MGWGIPLMDPMEHKILLLFILYKTKTANKEINMQCSELQLLPVQCNYADGTC